MLEKLFLLICVTVIIAQEDTKTIVLEHAFDDAAFTKRGTITCKTAASITQSKELSETQAFSSLLNNGGLYRLRAPSLNSTLSVLACSLVASDFQDGIILHLDNTGAIISFDYYTPVACTTHQQLIQNQEKFRNRFVSSKPQWKTTLTIQKAVESPSPVMDNPVSSTDIEKEQQQQPPKEQEQGFFAKYWYVIVPMVAMMLVNNLLSGAADGAGGGTQRGSATAQRRPSARAQ